MRHEFLTLSALYGHFVKSPKRGSAETKSSPQSCCSGDEKPSAPRATVTTRSSTSVTNVGASSG
jgi:hypothetical protein